MAKILKANLILILILVIAIFLRIYKLNVAPPELFGDELDVGYQAYSILHTGRDLYGNFLPTYFHSLSEFRAPLFLYSAVPFVAIFGLNEWGVRLTAAFWGVLGILVFYFLTKKLFKSKFISLTSCFLLAVSPWHLQYSRAGFEVTLLLFLLMSGVWLFLKGLGKPAYLVLAAFIFALTFYTYSTAAVFTPLLILALFLIYKDKILPIKNSLSFKVAIFVFVIILIPFIWQFLSGQAGLRFSQINIISNPQAIKKIVDQRSLDKTGGVIFHNKLSNSAYEFWRSYLFSFSPQFLFTDGDTIGRHSPGGMGELFWFQLPLLAVVIFWLIRGKFNLERKSLILILAWLFLAPIPSSLTYQGGNSATRLILMLPPLTILSAISVDIISKFPKKINTTKYLALFILMIVALINFVFYLHQYYVHYPVESWRAWQVGYKEAFTYIKENQQKYKTVLINNTYEPSLIRFLFYMRYDPAQFHQKFTGDVGKNEVTRGFDGFALDKFYFGTLAGRASGLGAIATVLTPDTLYLASARDEIGEKVYLGVDSERGVKILKVVKNYLGQPIFYLLSK